MTSIGLEASRKPASGARARAVRRDRFGSVIIGAASLIMLGLVWQAAISLGYLDVAFIGSPVTVYNAGKRLLEGGALFNDVLESGSRVLIGFALSCAVAIPLGLAAGCLPLLKAIIDPVVSLIRPLPSLSWIPLSMMWLGIGEEQKYAIVFMGTFAPTLVFVIDATEQVDRIYVRAARNLGAGRWAVIFQVILPAALPGILSALKVTLALAWACIISAEMVGATSGLGYLIWNAKDWGNISQVLVGMLVISASVLVLDILHRALTRRLIPWRRDQVSNLKL
ncbi:taurine transport system permease protein [Rhodoligotrophos appendicifer]|uniref:ABC transporter permease n=1 Tax=Rhodoligotrophos appendicifer TaxID=987056 RepID=UPI001186BE6D|nr:ABC transporter permease [Rhodoligotrophos appendicifer]